MTFNAASREVCMVRTERTNTPLQALTLMNNKIFVESARKLAERMIKAGEDSLESQIETGFELLLVRKPSRDELDVLVDLYGQMHDRFKDEPERAQSLLKTGESDHDESLNDVSIAAMTVVASAILNLDETVVKP